MSTSRAWFASAALAAALAVAGAAGGQQFRGGGRVTEEYARAAEALIGAALPGATRDWSDDSLVWPDGRREAFRLGGFTRLRVGDEWWIAGALDFPARMERAVAALRAGQARAETVRSRLVVVRTASDWRVLAQRVIEVDADSPVSAIDHVEIDPPQPGQWPQLRVKGVSCGQRDGAGLIVWWAGQVDPASGTWVSRVPGEVWRRGPDGREQQELLQSQATEKGLELVGVTSGERLAFPCAGGACKIRPLSLLERKP